MCQRCYMKSLLASILAVVVSFNVSAKMTEIKFKPTNQEVETQLCIAAAKGGIDAARKAAQALDVKFSAYKHSIYCNDKSLTKFAKTYQVSEQPVKAIENVTYKFVPANQASASQICTFAVENGMRKAKKEFNNVENLYCNGEWINTFVRKNKKA